MLRATRLAAVSITVAPLWPVIVDGTILSATMAVLALGAYGAQQRANRSFFWWVLALAAMASVGSNALHAIVAPGNELAPWLKAAIGVVPPVSLLATAHGAAILSRIRPMTVKAARVQQETRQAQRAAERRRYWVSTARTIQQKTTYKTIADRPVEQIADVLESINDGGQSQRAISSSTGLHHETIRKILQAGVAAIGSAPA